MVAIIDRTENLLIPQTPWPLVQPIPICVPIPTRRPPIIKISVLLFIKYGTSEVVEELVSVVTKYDLVAVQEVKDIDQTVPYEFLEEINNFTGGLWNMSLSQRSGLQEDDKSSQEQYIFYYNTTVFSEIGQGELYNDSEHDYFQREPYRASFDLLNESGKGP